MPYLEIPGMQTPPDPISRKRILGARKGFWITIGALALLVLVIAAVLGCLRLIGGHAWQIEQDEIARLSRLGVGVRKQQVLPSWLYGVAGERVVEVWIGSPRLMSGPPEPGKGGLVLEFADGQPIRHYHTDLDYKKPTVREVRAAFPWAEKVTNLNN